MGRGVGRGRGRGLGSVGGRGRTADVSERDRALSIKELNCKDDNVVTFPFTPTRSAGTYLPMNTDPDSPEQLFKLFFDDEATQMICNATNEYASLQKDNKPVMFSYYKDMTSVDLYNLLGIIIHLGYCKVSPSMESSEPLLRSIHFTGNESQSL